MQRIVRRSGHISGSIFALTFVVGMLFKEQLGFDYGAILGYAAMLVSFLMVYFGVRAYRDTELNGSIKFGRAFGVGILITLVGCAFYVSSWEIVYFKNSAVTFMEPCPIGLVMTLISAGILSRRRRAGAVTSPA